MCRPIEITRTDLTSGELRARALKISDAAVVRRLLAIALLLEGRARVAVGQQGTLEYVWVPIGSRPLAVRDNRRDSVYSVRCARLAVHLREISSQIAPGAHAILVRDGAGWHQRGGRLLVPDNITLLPLPPYSPELNLMENVWDYLRGNMLSHKVWDTYNAIVQACAKAWRFLIADPERIRSIAHRDWASVNG